MNKEFTCRRAIEEDAALYFKWTNDEEVRKQSYNSDSISYENHLHWFKQNLNAPGVYFYLFEEQSLPLGQVRIQKSDSDDYIIGISIDKDARGKGYASYFIKQAVRLFFEEVSFAQQIAAYIKKENISSLKSFTNAGFTLENMVSYKGYESYKMIKKNENR